MKSHPALSLRHAKARLTHVVRQAERHGTSYVITRDGKPAAAVVPLSALELLDASDVRRARALYVALRRLVRLLPAAARADRAK